MMLYNSHKNNRGGAPELIISDTEGDIDIKPVPQTKQQEEIS